MPDSVGVETVLAPDISLATIWRTVLVTDARNSSKAYFSEKADEALARIERDRTLFLQVAVAHGGEEVRDRGDGSMFAFCDPVEAVRAAMSMQEKMARLNEAQPPETLRLVHRMGIHMGEIKVATTRVAVGGKEEVRRKLSGDIVVTASRLEGICHPGEVCFSNDVYKAIRGSVDHEFRCLDSTLKGFERPVRCWSSRLDREWARPLTAEEEAGKERRKEEKRLREKWEAEQRAKIRWRRRLSLAVPFALIGIASAAAAYAWSDDRVRGAVTGAWKRVVTKVQPSIEPLADPSVILSPPEPVHPQPPTPNPVHPPRHVGRAKKRAVADPQLLVVATMVADALRSGDYAGVKDPLEALDPPSPRQGEIELDFKVLGEWKDWLKDQIAQGDVQAKELAKPLEGLSSITGLTDEGVEGTLAKGGTGLIRYADLTPRIIRIIGNTETAHNEPMDPIVESAAVSLQKLQRIAGAHHTGQASYPNEIAPPPDAN